MADEQTPVGELKAAVSAFAQEREWLQFHSPKNLSMALAAEAGELMEHFLWTQPEDSLSRARDPRRSEAIRDELADVIIYALQFANVAGIDVTEAVRAKMRQNAAKYPVEKTRGRSEKYNEL